jgi:hypothetical protein
MVLRCVLHIVTGKGRRVGGGIVNETELSWAHYFGFSRERLRRAREAGTTHGLVIICRYLGFLAEHWMATSEEPRQTTPTDCMRLFLARHGHHDAWSRVSAALLRDRTDSPLAKSAIEARFPFERFVADRVSPIATWKSDLRFAELEASRLVSRDLLVACSYAGLVYEEMISKCNEGTWLGSRTFETPWRDEPADGAPRYRYDSLTNTLRLLVPVSFLAETAERALRSFHVETIERGVPFPSQAPVARVAD